MFGEGSAIGTVESDSNHLVAQLAKKIGATTLLNSKALIDILTEQYSFPDRHRVLIWRYLLRLPMNNDVFFSLSSQKIHQSVRLLQNKVPIRFSNISNRIVRVISELTYWHPPLAECDWLPALVFPFVQIFQRDSLITFEVIATIICNWCGEWLHFVPNPPITILSRIDRISQDFGGEAPLSFAWPILRSFFGNIATTHAALVILDNVISSKPVFIEYLVATYALMKGNVTIDDQNVHDFIKKARRIYAKDNKNNPNNDVFSPLPKGYYPVLVIVQKSPMWREKELKRIREEAEATSQEMELAAEIEKNTETISRQRTNWMNERTVLRQIEEEQMLEFRRHERENLSMTSKEEKKLIDSKRREISTRKVNEENAINEWRNDCKRIQDEMKKVVEIRRETWENWLAMKEETGKLAHEETDAELALLDKRDQAQDETFNEHTEILNQMMEIESKMLNQAAQRSQEIDGEKDELRQVLERARKKQADKFRERQAKLNSNK